MVLEVIKMGLKKDNYIIRLIDDKIDSRLKIFGAICIEERNGVVKLGHV